MSTHKVVNEWDNFTNALTGNLGDVEKYSKDKSVIADTIVANVLDKMQGCFKWNNLPDTIPQRWLEVMLMKNGFACVTEFEGNLYAFWGGLGGEYDEYYQPTICVISNPWLKFDKDVKIYNDEEGVLVSNDTLRRGIIPLIGKYAGLLAENTVTIRIADIMARVTNIISGSDEGTIESVKEYLRQLEQGKLGVIQESTFLEDLKVQVASDSAHQQITDLIELEQYLKASLYNELGLQANYNMKRESINSDEAQMDNDMIKPFIQNMLEMRQDAAARINAKYGTDISVEFNGVWAEKQKEEEIALDNMEKEPEDDTKDNPETPKESSEPDVEPAEQETPEVREPEEQDSSEDEPETEQADDEANETGTESVEPSVEVNVTVVNNDDGEVEVNNGDPDESDDSDSIPDGGDPDESEKSENGGVADGD